MIQEESDGGAVLVNFDTGNAVSLNSVGKFIWEAADGTISVPQIIEKIKVNFQTVPDDIGEDVSRLVNILKLYGFFGREMTDNKN
jgi:hypothetical protein